jgi:hypothetical protein
MKNICGRVYFSRPGSRKFLYLRGGWEVEGRERNAVSTKVGDLSVSGLERGKKKREAKNVLFARGVRFKTRLPRVEGLFESSIVSNVLAKRQLAVDIVVLAVGSLDGKVPVLIHETLCLLVECLFCRICPPLFRVGYENLRDEGCEAVENEERKDDPFQGQWCRLTLWMRPMES